MRLMLLSGIQPSTPIPDLDRYIDPTDLDVIIKDLHPDTYFSSGEA